jgi:hypothetical protein
MVYLEGKNMVRDKMGDIISLNILHSCAFWIERCKCCLQKPGQMNIFDDKVNCNEGYTHQDNAVAAST